MEIFRIAPVRYPLVGTPSTILVSNRGAREVQTAKGVEIKAAILPEETVTGCAMIPDGDSEQECFKGRWGFGTVFKATLQRGVSRSTYSRGH